MDNPPSWTIFLSFSLSLSLSLSLSHLSIICNQVEAHYALNRKYETRKFLWYFNICSKNNTILKKRMLVNAENVDTFTEQMRSKRAPVVSVVNPDWGANDRQRERGSSSRQVFADWASRMTRSSNQDRMGNLWIDWLAENSVICDHDRTISYLINDNAYTRFFIFVGMSFVVSDRQPVEMLIASVVNFPLDHVAAQRIWNPSREWHNIVTSNFWKKDEGKRRDETKRERSTRY
jgi:hypothetical protein